MTRLRTTWPLITLSAILLFVLSLISPQNLLAQGCALCYTQAASSTQRFIQALRSGILILVLPPMLLSVMFTVIAYRRRNLFNQDAAVADRSEDPAQW